MQEIELKEKLTRWGGKLEKGLARWLRHYIATDGDKPLSLRRIATEVGKGLLCGGAAFLLSRGASLGGTRPFGLALLCAAGNRGSYLLGGLLLSFLTGGSGIMYGVASILCFALRFLVGRLLGGKREPLWREPLPIRMAVAAAGGFTVGLYGIFSGGLYSPEEIGDPGKVKLVFLSCGSKEYPEAILNATEALKAAGYNAVDYVSEGTAHEFQTWRRSLKEMAPLLFRK